MPDLVRLYFADDDESPRPLRLSPGSAHGLDILYLDLPPAEAQALTEAFEAHDRAQRGLAARLAEAAANRDRHRDLSLEWLDHWQALKCEPPWPAPGDGALYRLPGGEVHAIWQPRVLEDPQDYRVTLRLIGPGDEDPITQAREIRVGRYWHLPLGPLDPGTGVMFWVYRAAEASWPPRLVAASGLLLARDALTEPPTERTDS